MGLTHIRRVGKVPDAAEPRPRGAHDWSRAICAHHRRWIGGTWRPAAETATIRLYPTLLPVADHASSSSYLNFIGMRCNSDITKGAMNFVRVPDAIGSVPGQQGKRNDDQRQCATEKIWRSVLVSMLLGALGAPAMAQSIPDFSGLWENRDEYFKAPESGPGPVMSLTGAGIRGSYYQADYNNPVLMPWVKEVLKKNQETDKNGLQASPAAISAAGRLDPGVMAIRNVVEVLQTSKMVVSVHQRSPGALRLSRSAAFKTTPPLDMVRRICRPI